MRSAFRIRFALLFSFSILLFQHVGLIAQDELRTEFKNVYAELGGNGGTYSLNFENKFAGFKKSRLNWSAGLSVWPGKQRAIIGIPVGINWVWGLRKHQFEAATGQIFLLDIGGGNGGAFRGTFRIGYRFDPPGHRYYLRFAYTPFYSYMNNLQYEHWWGFAFGFYLKKTK